MLGRVQRAGEHPWVIRARSGRSDGISHHRAFVSSVWSGRNRSTESTISFVYTDFRENPTTRRVTLTLP